MKRHMRLEVESNSCVHMFINEPCENAKACIVFSHGFLVPGFESHRMFLGLSNELVAKGYKTVLFDYRGSGYSDFDFSEMTLDTEIKDLHAVIDFVPGNEAAGREIIIWGQSLGSGVASLVTCERNDVDRLILWCLSAKLYERYRTTLGVLQDNNCFSRISNIITSYQN